MIYTVINAKGGVGKTTTVYALCCGLLEKGYKVLAVDLDPQGNLSYTSGHDEEEVDIYSVFTKRATAREAIVKAEQGFDLIPGGLNMASADLEFTNVGKEYILQEALAKVKEDYDFIIIDTPPALSVLTVNALTASERAIVPMSAEVYSLQGLGQLQKLIETVKKYCNPDLEIDGLLMTKYSDRAVVNKYFKDQIKQAAEMLNTRLYETTIREAVAVKEVQLTKGNIFKEMPNAKITQDFKQFIEEFERK